MTTLQDIAGPELGPAAGGPPRQLVVLLHGWGADGNDLIGLAPMWAGRLPGALFVSPHAPLPCDIGFGRQWFSLEDRRPAAMLAGAEAAAPVLDRFLDGLLARHGLDDSRLALVGFSQGTMMALHVAPRRQRPCACVVGYSGALLAGERLAAEARVRPPILLVHGAEDPIVPATALPHATDALNGAGFAVESALRPGVGHGIDEPGLEMGGRFIARAFAAGAPGQGEAAGGAAAGRPGGKSS